MILKVPGGGAAEMAMSSAVMDQRQHDTVAAGFAQAIEVCDQALVRSDALLEVVPVCLAKSAGLDPAASISQLRVHHSGGRHEMGVAVMQAELNDMAALEVWEPLSSKASQVPFLNIVL